MSKTEASMRFMADSYISKVVSGQSLRLSNVKFLMTLKFSLELLRSKKTIQGLLLDGTRQQGLDLREHVESWLAGCSDAA